MVRSIKILQYFAALLKLEDGIWYSLEKHGRFVVGIHGNSELTGEISECQNVVIGICFVEKY